MVTVQELENAKIDARTIGESVNENKIVTPRYGAPFKSMPMIAEEMQSVIGTIIAGGVPASIVVDASGLSQQQVNNNAFVVKSISEISSAIKINNYFVSTKSYHSDLNSGGNKYYYDATLSKSLHDGGRYIDPSKIFPIDWANKTQQLDWFTPSISGTGVFVLIKNDVDICASDYGAHETKESCYAIQSAVNYSAYRCAIYADVPLNTTETINIKNGMGLRGDHYTHNSRSTLKTSILNYTGTGDAVKFGEDEVTARNVTLKNIHLYDVNNIARCSIIAYDIVGGDVDIIATGFENSAVVQNWLYYIEKFKVFGYNYRKNGVLIGGNINEGTVEFKLISTSLEIEKGFMCGVSVPALGVIASASNNPTISGSVEQNSGRHFDFNQIRGGTIKPYFESPAADGSTYQNIQTNIARCYGSDFTIYGSGKSGYSAYMDNSRDCKVSGELKGATTADLFVGTGCVGIDTSQLRASKISTTNFSTGTINGRASSSSAVRSSVGAATATPVCGGYGVGSKLWYTNPTLLTSRTVVTDVTFTAPSTLNKTTETYKRREIGKLVTTAGSFGTLPTTTATGLTGENIITINSGANNILVGDYLSLPSNSGSYLIEYIYQELGVTKCRLGRSLAADISSATVTYFSPSTEPMIIETI